MPVGELHVEEPRAAEDEVLVGAGAVAPHGGAGPGAVSIHRLAEELADLRRAEPLEAVALDEPARELAAVAVWVTPLGRAEVEAIAAGGVLDHHVAGGGRHAHEHRDEPCEQEL